jgi:general secretion pathway protein A
LRIAGAAEPLFVPEAIELVHRYSNGIPRLINLICEHALINGFVEHIKPVPARIIDLVSVELDLDQQPFVLSPMALSGLADPNMPAGAASNFNPVKNFTNPLKDTEL